jgi:gamma-glutamyl-gamma-aminobutyrate hydrolase PuuD
MTKKIYVVGGANHYASFIDDYTLVNNVNDADIVMFTGGEDVDPSLYDAKHHHSTISNICRDLKEKEIFESINPSQKVIGICRGSQFMAVMNGGKLVQNVNNHAMWGTHQIINSKQEIFEITSTHHQMQYPYNLPSDYYDVLFTSHNNSSLYYEGINLTNDEFIFLHQNEPEIVKYTVPGNPVCLAIQGHPEMMRKDAPIIKKLNELINQL